MGCPNPCEEGVLLERQACIALPVTTMRVGVAAMNSLVDHFEQVLGPIHTGWSVDPDGSRMPFQIVRFSGGSDVDSVGYATLGLSRYALTSPTTGRDIRQELLILAPDSLSPDIVVSLLLQVGTAALAAQRALLRGHVIGPAGAMTPGSCLTAFYVTMPTYFPDNFSTVSVNDEDIVVSWLVPISTDEAQFVSREGWSRFEDILVERNPDLVDFQRPSVEGIG